MTTPHEPAVKPAAAHVQWRLTCFTAFFWLPTIALVAIGGCSALSKSGDDSGQSLKTLLAPPTAPSIVGQGTKAIGMQPLVVTGVGAVNSLEGTGGAPDPSLEREQLLEEMRRQDVQGGEIFLESPTTALVDVQAIIPPGARRGDTIEARIQCPTTARATDLAGGWLLDCRLHQELRVDGGIMGGPNVRKGDCLAIVTGPVTTNGSYRLSGDPADQVVGRVIGGGKVQQDREIGLAVVKPYVHAKIAEAIADSISERFFFFNGSTRAGIATATTESRIDLQIPPRYRHSIGRLMVVVSEVVVSPKLKRSQARLRELSVAMDTNATAAKAAIQLEAIGEAAVPILLEKLESDDQEIRFYAAEALAYLDRREAVEVLAQSIAEVPAFRASALIAMRDFDNAAVDKALTGLLAAESMETRYGAFVILQHRESSSVGITTRRMGNYAVHSLSIPGSDIPPSIIASMQNRAEIILLGDIEPISLTTFLRDKRGLMIRQSDANRLEISKFAAGKPDRTAQTGTTVVDLIEGLARIGLSYGEVLTMLNQAKEEGVIQTPLVVDPLPETMRVYHRNET